MPLPDIGVWASEASVAWKYLRSLGHKIVILTETGNVPEPDPISLEGVCGDLYPSSSHTAKNFWNEMVNPEEGRAIPWGKANWDEADCVIVVGGHHPGMIQMLKNKPLLRIISRLWQNKRILFAGMCHGNYLFSFARNLETHLPLYWNMRGTCLPKYTEKFGFKCLKLTKGKRPEDYQLSITWPLYLEESVKISMEDGLEQFIHGETNMLHHYYSDFKNTDIQLVVENDNFVSCRSWADNWAFATSIGKKLLAQPNQ